MNAIEMIGSTSKTVLAGLIEVLAEILIRLRGSLRSLDHNETDGALVDHALVLQHVPVDAALMVGDVDAVDLIALGITNVAIEGAPTESEG